MTAVIHEAVITLLAIAATALRPSALRPINRSGCHQPSDR
jgi:hypothetical protein